MWKDVRCLCQFRLEFLKKGHGDGKAAFGGEAHNADVKEMNAGHVQLDSSVRNLVEQEGSKITQCRFCAGKLCHC